MGETDDDHQLVRDLVDWAGGIPSRVAKEIGAAATTITRHYNGKATTRLGRDTVQKLRQRYPDFPGWGIRNQTVRAEVASFGDRPFDEKYGSGDLPAIPLVGTAMGADSFDPERDIELTELDMAEVLEHVARPVSLARDKEAYALTVVGDSMYPRFRPGRRVIVSPRAPVSIGDDVVVQLKGGPGEGDHRDRVSTVLIKEMVRRSATFIELRQFNPEVTFRVEQERVAAIHKVIGEVY
ncbi:S24 family peptidase [Sphingomonas sp. URHD0057]|uniref:S24 family peptidase n=1 Tax=Sphingomonas sp. URHD0057 TaxID=1380389 RepID=UPI0018CC3640|nr:helix-turn-helix transcriptional regulator [Sphingomonas sp. URHD0057]